MYILHIIYMYFIYIYQIHVQSHFLIQFSPASPTEFSKAFFPDNLCLNSSPFIFYLLNGHFNIILQIKFW